MKYFTIRKDFVLFLFAMLFSPLTQAQIDASICLSFSGIPEIGGSVGIIAANPEIKFKST
jgi:hypothetical protein